MKENEKTAKTKNLKFNFNIPVLFERTFGITPNRGEQQLIDKVIDYKDIDTLPNDQVYEHTSKLGVPVWDVVSLDEKLIEGTNDKFIGYSFPAEMTVEVSRAKNSIETDIVGMEGSVEELVSSGDWSITLRGFIINYESTAYPEQEVRELSDVCKLKDTLMGVTSNYLNNLEIEFLSLHNLRLPQLPGYTNVQPFEITAKSKQPFIVDVSNGIEL